MFAWSSALLTFLCTIRLCTALTGNHIAEYFEAHLSPHSGVYLPGSKNYTDAVTPRWDLYRTPSYVIAVKPASKSDVQTIVNVSSVQGFWDDRLTNCFKVKYASQNQIPFLATGGGHGYISTIDSVQDGIDLDLGNFKEVSVNASANLLTVGGAAKFGSVVEALQVLGKETPVGSCMCIGMLGATLGGGIGPYSGLHGPFIDSLVSVEMITGTGEALQVSSSEHPDLFWALKGAGHNFGIVTSATYRVYDATNGGQVVNADMILPSSLNASVWAYMQSLVADQPKELFLNVAIGYNASTEKSMLIVNGQFAGGIRKAREVLQPLLDLQPFNLNITSLPWKDASGAAVYGLIAEGCVPKGETDFAVNLQHINVSSLIEVTNFMNESQSRSALLQSSLLSISQIGSHGFRLRPQSSAVFPHRETIAYLQVQGTVPNATAGPTVNAWGRQIRHIAQLGSGSRALRAYVNYAQGDEGDAAWYSAENLPRLKRLKRRYDPMMLFSHYAPISLST
ncbi:MAG: hypothetical protein M1828_002453 [Chrysothrix sp. TS-e1954]|nr:MAG: hypothetical protein M1828_002453 [Chrysothrix sp. TS-e1954]